MCHSHATTSRTQISHSHSIQPHAQPRDWRRRSADIGGLQLAMASAASSRHSATAGFGDLGAGLDLSWKGENSTASSREEDAPFGAQGQGWLGGEADEVSTRFAELLSDMYNETLNSVNDNILQSPPPATPDSVRSRLIWSLDRWNFEPHLLPDDEVLACTLILFETLFRIEGMAEVIPLTMQQITSFIHHLRRIYRYENSYHNFEHALDVLQATQSYLKSAGVVPPPTILFQPPSVKWKPEQNKSWNGGSLMATLGLRELFILYVAAIGHDVGHPGFSNVFMKNAQAPLDLLFSAGSALEHLHCQLLLRVMRYHGFSVLLDHPQHGGHLRKLLHASVLATDMGVHDDFMQKLKSVVDGERGSLCQRQTVLCQALLKNADISNPTRPFLVSKHWAGALFQEWTSQAHLEDSYHLKQTVPATLGPNAVPDPLKEAGSQIYFIDQFAKPLLELTQRAVPEMWMYVVHCRANLKTWSRRQKTLLEERKRAEEEAERREKQQERSKSLAAAAAALSPDDDDSSASVSTSASSASLSSLPPPPMSPPRGGQYHTAFRLTLPTQQPPLLASLPHAPPSTTSTRSSTSSSDQSPFTNGPRGGDAELDAYAYPLSVPDSPNTDASSSASAIFSPVSETHSHSGGSTSNADSTLSNSTHLPVPLASSAAAANAAIRAASKVGSFRKKSQTGLDALFGVEGFVGGGGLSKRKGARNSWCASSLTGLFHAPSTSTPPTTKATGQANWEKLEKLALDVGFTGPTSNSSPRSSLSSEDDGKEKMKGKGNPTPLPTLMTRPVKLQVLP